MQQLSGKSRLFEGLLLSVGFHGLLLLVIASGSPPPPEPVPFALDALGELAQFQLQSLSESGRVFCASFPPLCEKEKFVELDMSTDPAVPFPEPEEEELIEIAAVIPENSEDPPEEQPEVEPPPEEQPQPEEIPEVEIPPVAVQPAVQVQIRKKSVEQIVEKEDEYNPDAQFLAEQTKIVEKQTQAKVTSDYIMDKEAGGISDPNAPEHEDPGSDKPEVAGAENLAAAPTDNKRAIRKQNEVDPQELIKKSPGEIAEGKKGLAGKSAPLAESFSEIVNAATAPGEDGSGGQSNKGSGKGGKEDGGKKDQPRLKLTMEDFEELYGDQEGAKKGQQDKRSYGKGGKSEKRRKFVMAQLENYLPEVEPGNQTALSTARDPFARFIHQMHLRIHREWGQGTLRDFDGLGGTNPLNDPGLAVALEIVVNSDGTLDKAAPVGSSGFSAYDVSAVTAVYDAGPFPRPPERIRSYNGKVYLRWIFHRNARQCATAFAEPYIVTGPPAREKPSDSSN